MVQTDITVIQSSKRLTANINGEIFKTQKSLIDRVKPMLDEYAIKNPDNQQFQIHLL